MDLFGRYTFEEAINHETGFIRRQPQVYYKLIDNLRRVSNLILKPKQESKRGPSQTTKISEPPQGGKYSLKSVVFCGAKEEKLGDRKESSLRNLIRPQEGGV